MKTSSKKTYKFEMSDNRKTILMNKILSKISSVLEGMERVKTMDADIMVVFSFTGEILSKKLFHQIVKFQNLNRKCFIYSDHSNSIREIIRVEKSEKDFGTNSMYAIVLHAGMKLDNYNRLIRIANVTTRENPET